MEDLVRWLTACLDEDEEEARRGYLKAEPLPDYDGWDKSTVAGLPPVMAARMLREIDADRKLLAQYAEVAANDVDDVEYAHGWANALGLAVRLRATKYSDRPGYREEWRP